MRTTKNKEEPKRKNKDKRKNNEINEKKNPTSVVVDRKREKPLNNFLVIYIFFLFVYIYYILSTIQRKIVESNWKKTIFLFTFERHSSSYGVFMDPRS